MATENFRNQLEPSGLLQQFTNHPPEGFALLKDWPVPAFTAPFDLLTTADDALKARLLSFPGGRWLSSRLRLQTDFVGTTVSEYALLPQTDDAMQLARQLHNHAGRRMLTIVKDLPQSSPLLCAEDNAFSAAFADALKLVRLRAEAQLGGNAALPELERHLQLHQDNLRLYQAIFAKDFAHADEHDRTLFIHKSILQLGIDLEIGWINWLENLIPALKSFDESSSNQAKYKEN